MLLPRLFEGRSLLVRAVLNRIINTSKNTNVKATSSEGDSLLMQLLQKQMTIMERYEMSNIPQARATSDSLRNQEDDGALKNLLRAQNEILYNVSPMAIRKTSLVLEIESNYRPLNCLRSMEKPKNGQNFPMHLQKQFTII